MSGSEDSPLLVQDRRLHHDNLNVPSDYLGLEGEVLVSLAEVADPEGDCLVFLAMDIYDAGVFAYLAASLD